MKRQPITYLGLCETLLNAGVDAQAIIKHRFVLQAIGASAYTPPTEIDYNAGRFTFHLTNGDRSQVFEFSRLSTAAKVWRVVAMGDATFKSSTPTRVALTNAGDLMLELYPIENDYAWHERLRVWIETKWLQLKERLEKIRA